MKSGIYQIINKINGKFYIGSAIYLKDRKSNHFARLDKNKHCNLKLQNAYNKYGAEAFEFKTLELCEKEKLLEREQFWIDWLQACVKGYNILPTAGSRLGFKASEETKLKQSNSMKGKKLTAEHKRNLKRAFVPTAEQRLKMSQAKMGRKHSEETKLKIGKGNKGKIISIETREKLSNWQKGKIIPIHQRLAVSEANKRRIGMKYNKNSEKV